MITGCNSVFGSVITIIAFITLYRHPDYMVNSVFRVCGVFMVLTLHKKKKLEKSIRKKIIKEKKTEGILHLRRYGFTFTI